MFFFIVSVFSNVNLLKINEHDSMRRIMSITVLALLASRSAYFSFLSVVCF